MVFVVKNPFNFFLQIFHLKILENTCLVCLNLNFKILVDIEVIIIIIFIKNLVRPVYIALYWKLPGNFIKSYILVTYNLTFYITCIIGIEGERRGWWRKEMCVNKK